MIHLFSENQNYQICNVRIRDFNGMMFYFATRISVLKECALNAAVNAPNDSFFSFVQIFTNVNV